MTLLYIDTAPELATLCDTLANSDWIALDTEFIREKTYRPQLCLIQVATQDVIACVDPIALADDLDPLLDVLYRQDITIVFHAASQDLEIFHLLRDALPAPVFDTQIAATVLGYGEQIGYANLVKKCLNIDLDKAHSRTDWARRPLSEGQISYAADDVRYLRQVYLQLVQELADKGRTDWLTEEFNLLTDPAKYRPDPTNIWHKLRGGGRLKGVQLAILQSLCEWREHRAINKDRPRRWILKDDILLDLARIGPDSPDQLQQIRGLEEGAIKRYADIWLDLIKTAKSSPKDSWPILKKPHILSSEQDATSDILMGLLRKYSAEHDISPAAIATRKDIDKLVIGEQNIPLLQGWRHDIIGSKLKAFLNGDDQLSISYGKINIT
jgi:ribonuclease D